MDDGDGSKKGSYEQDALGLMEMGVPDEEDHMRTAAGKDRENETEEVRGMPVVLLGEPSEEFTTLKTTDAAEDPELKMISLDAARDEGNKEPDVDGIPQELETRSLEMPRDGSQTGKASFLIDALKEFAGSTTMHGAPKIILAKSPVKLIVWLLVFIGCWATFIYQTILVCDNYFKYPKKIDIVIRERPVPYPAITFCNKRGVSLYDSEMRRLGKSHLKRKYFWGVDPKFQSPELVKIYENSAIPKEEFFVKISAEYKREYGNVKYERTQIMFKNIKEFWAGDYFKCYTLTIPEFEVRARLITITGVLMAGNGMISSIEEAYFWQPNMVGKDGVNGVRIYIHPAGTTVYPEFENDYLDLKPGKLAKIFIKFKNTIRVGQPHGNCTNENPFLQNKTDNVYSFSECKLLCLSSQFIQKTGKVNIFYPPLDNMNCLDDEEVEAWMEDLAPTCYQYTKGVFTNEKALIRSAEGLVCGQSHLIKYYLQDDCYRISNNTLTRESVTPRKRFSMEKICFGKENELRTMINEHVYDKRFCNISTPGAGGETIIRTLPTASHPQTFKFKVEDCGCHPPCNDVTYDVLLVDSDQPPEYRANGITYRLKNIFKEKSLVPIGGETYHTNYSGRFRSRIQNDGFSGEESWTPVGNLVPIHYDDPGNVRRTPRDASVTVELPDDKDGKFLFIDSYIRNNTEKALKDLATFEIIFPDHSIPTVFESPLYTPTQLISEIGGQLGIWIGVSAITLTEVIEFLISVLSEMFQKKKKQERQIKKEEIV